MSKEIVPVTVELLYKRAFHIQVRTLQIHRSIGLSYNVYSRNDNEKSFASSEMVNLLKSRDTKSQVYGRLLGWLDCQGDRNGSKGESVKKINEKYLREEPVCSNTEIDKEWLNLMSIAQSIGLSTEEVRQFIRSKSPDIADDEVI